MTVKKKKNIDPKNSVVKERTRKERQTINKIGGDN